MALQGPQVQSIVQTNSGGSTTETLTVLPPSGINSGDYLFIYVGSDDATSTEQFSISGDFPGWNKLVEAGSAVSDCHIGYFWKFADGSEGAVDILAVSADEMLGWYGRITGVNSTNPIDDYAIVDLATSSVGYFSLGAAFFVVDDLSLALAAFVTDGADMMPFGPSIGKYTSPIGYDQSSGTSSNDVGGSIGHYEIAVSGFPPGEGWKEYDPGSSDDGTAGIVVVLRPSFTLLNTDAESDGSATVSGVSSSTHSTEAVTPVIPVDYYYFDDSGSGWIDRNSTWSNEDLAYDNDIDTDLNRASTISIGTPTFGDLRSNGTNAPLSGGIISQVRTRMYYGTSDAITIVGYNVYESDGITLLSHLEGSIRGQVSGGWSDWTTLTEHSGGWDWAKLQTIISCVYGIARTSNKRIWKLEIEVSSLPSIATVEGIGDFILGGDIYYFDESDVAATGSDQWNDPALAFDGSIITKAFCTQSGTLEAEGTNAPTSGATIDEVHVRVYGEAETIGSGYTTIVYEDSIGGTQLSSIDLLPAEGEPEGWGAYNILSIPGGGWTWQKINDLAFSSSCSLVTLSISKIEITVLSSGGGGNVIEADADSLGTSTVLGLSEVIAGVEATSSGLNTTNGVSTNTILSVAASTGLATIAGQTSAVVSTEGASDGSSTVLADSAILTSADADITGISTAQADSTNTALTDTAIVGTSTAQTDSSVLTPSEADITGTASVLADSTNTVLTDTAITGTATAQADSSVVISTEAATVSTSTAQADSSVLTPSDADVAATASVLGDSTNTALTDTAIAGATTVLGDSTNIALTDTAIAGAATVLGDIVDGNVATSADGEVIGTSTVLADSATIKIIISTIAGTSIALGDTAATAVSIGSIDGSSLVVGNTSYSIATVAVVVGTSTAQVDTQAISSGTSTISGTSSISIQANYIVNTTGNAAGTAIAIGVSGVPATTVANSIGIATESIIAAVIWQTDTSSIGTATSSADSGVISQTEVAVTASSSVSGDSELIIATDANAVGTSVSTSNTSSTNNVQAESFGLADVSGLVLDLIYSSIAASTGDSTVLGEASSGAADEADVNINGTSTVVGITSYIVSSTASSTGTSTITGDTPAVYELEGFRFRNDNGTEITATWKAAQDISIAENIEITTRLRTILVATGDPGPHQVTLQYKKVTDPDTEWRTV